MRDSLRISLISITKSMVGQCYKTCNLNWAFNQHIGYCRVFCIQIQQSGRNKYKSFGRMLQLASFQLGLKKKKNLTITFLTELFGREKKSSSEISTNSNSKNIAPKYYTILDICTTWFFFTDVKTTIFKTTTKYIVPVYITRFIYLYIEMLIFLFSPIFNHYFDHQKCNQCSKFDV